MDNVELCLLTSTRHHQQLAEFQAASQADTVAAEPEVDAGAATQQATEHPVRRDIIKQRKKRPNKVAAKDSEESDEAIAGSDSEEEFRVSKTPAKKKGKKNN